MDFYGNIQLKFIFINIIIDGVNKGFKFNLFYIDFKFGIIVGCIELFKRMILGIWVCQCIVIEYCILYIVYLSILYFFVICNVK